MDISGYSHLIPIWNWLVQAFLKASFADWSLEISISWSWRWASAQLLSPVVAQLALVSIPCNLTWVKIWREPKFKWWVERWFKPGDWWILWRKTWRIQNDRSVLLVLQSSTKRRRRGGKVCLRALPAAERARSPPLPHGRGGNLRECRPSPPPRWHPWLREVTINCSQRACLCWLGEIQLTPDWLSKTSDTYDP